jgi:hypothetical protein
MSLQHEITPVQIYRLMEYFGGTGGDRTINERTVNKGCEYDNGYVSRQWICFERCYCLISAAAGHRKLHEDQIGVGRVCLLYGFETRCGFNSVITGLLEMQHQQSSNVRIVINNEDLAPDCPRNFRLLQKTTGNHVSKL